MKKIKILDLGINSIGSIYSSFYRHSPGSITVVEDLSFVLKDELLVIPGNGNFGKASIALNQNNIRSDIANFKIKGGKIFGICLGMQLLGKSSEESLEGVGLNFIDSISKKFPEDRNLRIPNIGWAEIETKKNQFNFSSLRSPADFYFSHSYFLETKKDIPNQIFSKNGDFEFCCGILSEDIVAVQFHPEKSSKMGALFIADVIKWANG
jgi:imidazole glycerol phosphate synthase glutamine amidotransferase subunit